MRIARFFLAALLLGGTVLAGVATFGGRFVAPAEEAMGLSLREESLRARGAGFFTGYRSHRGGGLHGGK